jgi:hypothetical protein
LASQTAAESDFGMQCNILRKITGTLVVASVATPSAHQKVRPSDRAKLAAGVSSWGEDAFDAVMGIFGLIEVIDGRRAVRP